MGQDFLDWQYVWEPSLFIVPKIVPNFLDIVRKDGPDNPGFFRYPAGYEIKFLAWLPLFLLKNKLLINLYNCVIV